MAKKPKRGSDDTGQTIVIKRVKKVHHGGHGGSWKVAYADFVTAMMAFFLLMWLLGSVDQEKREAIGDYFSRPLTAIFSKGPHPGGDRVKASSQGSQRPGILSPGEEARQDSLRMQAFMEAVEQAVQTDPVLKSFQDQLRLETVPEGVRIQIVDQDDRPMFSGGSAIMSGYTADLVEKIAGLLQTMPNRIIVSGHTDATPYSGGERGYSNWELSADRAMAARRVLVAGGLEDRKLIRVEGLASTALSDVRNPFNPTNRRISFIVLSKKAEQAYTRQNESH